MKRILMSVVFLAVITALLSGCGSGVDSVKADPIDVKGTVNFSDGKPVDGVQISFFVLSQGGSPATVPVKAGAFTGKLIPGDYSYFFVEGKNPAALQAIPTAFQKNTSEHKITVSTSSTEFKLTVTK
jgi:hypothetical protein